MELTRFGGHQIICEFMMALDTARASAGVADVDTAAPSAYIRPTDLAWGGAGLSSGRRDTVAGIAALTGVRFVAATLVFISHAYDPALHLPAWLTTLMLAGDSGVTLFFVLSGFVICYNYHERFAARFRGAVGPFFLARFARIYPMYLLLLIWSASFVNVAQQWKSAKWLFIQHLAMTQAWNRDLVAVYSYNAVAWSVSVEAFFYLLFPFFAFLVLRHLRRAWQLALLGIVAWGAVMGVALYLSLTGNIAMRGDDHYLLYRLPLARFADFVLGCVTARLFMLRAATPVSATEQRRGAVVMGAALVIVLALMLTSWPPHIPFRFGPAYRLPFAAIVFGLARYGTPLGRVLSARLIVLLGSASYSFYLVHLNLLSLMRPNPTVVGAKTAYAHLLLAFLLIWVVALGMFTYLEAPLRAIIRARPAAP
jgi:peptidoglycan/LPS O-acetylase OafA/YrhL